MGKDGRDTRSICYQTTNINDSIWYSKYQFLDSASRITSKITEIYTLSNIIEFKDMVYYEYGLSKKAIEIKVKSSKQKLDFNKPTETYFAELKAPNNITVKVSAKLKHKLRDIDSLSADGSPCLIVDTKNTMEFYSPNGKLIKTSHAKSRRVYVKGRGLVYFRENKRKYVLVK